MRDNTIELRQPDWVLGAFSEIYGHLKIVQPVESGKYAGENFRTITGKAFRYIGRYLVDNKGTTAFYVVTVITSVFDAQMYIIPGEILAGADRVNDFLYPIGGFIPNLVLPIAFGKQTYDWGMDILRPSPGLEKVRTRKMGKTRVYAVTAAASTFGLLSAAEFAAVQVTEGGLSGFNIFLSVMVLLGNAIMNGKAGIGITSYPSLLLPLMKSGWAKVSAPCKGKTELKRERINAAQAEKDAEYLTLTQKVLSNGIWRIEDLLFSHPEIIDQNFSDLDAAFKNKYPYLKPENFDFLKTLYQKTRFGEAVLETTTPENAEELKQLLHLLLNISSDRQYREYPHFIRVLIGWPGALLGNASTAGYYALIILLLTAKFGDALGYTLDAASNLAFFYLVGIVSLDSFEVYAKGLYDIVRISAEKAHSAYFETSESTVSNFKELLPTAVRAYPGLTLLLALPLVGTAAYSFPTSVASTLTYVPQLLVKWFGGQVSDYLGLANSLTWPTIVGAFAFNGNPMFGVAQGVSLYFMQVLYRISSRVDSHKISTIVLRDFLSALVSHCFKAEPEYTMHLLQATTATKEVAQHDFNQDDLNNNNNAYPVAKELPFVIYSQNYKQEKSSRKYGSCSSTWIGYMTSFFVGRKIGGEEYAANLRGEQYEHEGSALLAGRSH